MKKLLIIMALILLPSIALANFSITFENTSDKKMVYMLYWIEHPYDWPQPANMAGGELEGMEKRHLSVNYRQGKYYVTWRGEDGFRNVMRVDVDKDVTLVTVTPKKVEF